MDYDYRNRSSGPLNPAPYNRSSTHQSPYGHGPPPASSSSSFYPTVGQPAHAPPPSSSYHPPAGAAPPPPSRLGIRVSIKPEYRIKPPPQLLPHGGDIPRCTFDFDFQLEKRIMGEVEKDPQNWSRVVSELFPTKPPPPDVTASPVAGSGRDPIVSKYIAAGLRGEAVPLAVANYGDNPTKVKEFVDGYNSLREMGFSSDSVAEALVMYDNDTDKAIAHFLSGS